MADQSGLRSFHFREYLQIFLLSVTVSLLLHASSLWKRHDEGDEIAYLALARQMNWDLSHYTTRDDREVSQFPSSIYRGPVFHHPPLFPLVLKIGDAILGNAVVAGFLFANAVMIVMLYYTWRWLVYQQIPPSWGAMAFAGVTFCPLLLASTMLLHHDALMGCLMASGLVAYLEALRWPSVKNALIAAALLVAGLNVRYNALIFLPCLAALQIDHLLRPAPALPATPSTGKRRSEKPAGGWLVFAIVAPLVLTVGLHHYLRVFLAYGSLLPSSFLIATPDADKFSPYLQYVARQTPWKTAINLVSIYPILLAFLIPMTYRPVLRSLREGSRAALFTPIFLFLLAVEFVFSYSQIRYFATITPCLYLGLPFLLQNQPARNRTIVGWLVAFSLLLMFATGFARTECFPPGQMAVIPALYFFIPPLQVFAS